MRRREKGITPILVKLGYAPGIAMGVYKINHCGYKALEGNDKGA